VGKGTRDLRETTKKERKKNGHNTMRGRWTGGEKQGRLVLVLGAFEGTGLSTTKKKREKNIKRATKETPAHSYTDTVTSTRERSTGGSVGTRKQNPEVGPTTQGRARGFQEGGTPKVSLQFWEIDKWFKKKTERRPSDPCSPTLPRHTGGRADLVCCNQTGHRYRFVFKRPSLC